MRDDLIKIIIALITGGAAAYLLLPRQEVIMKERYPVKKVIRDTVYEVVEAEPLVIEKVRTKIIRRFDTVIKTRPFTAKLDTIVNRDSVRAEYDFPENLMSLDIRRGPDSLRLQNMTVFRTDPREEHWWETPAYVAGAVIIGYLLGSAK